MAYGKFSEIYLAECWGSGDDNLMIKIGETDNARRRAKQLERDFYDITQTIDVSDGKAARLFIESYVRMRVLLTNQVVNIRTDYFKCDSIDVKMHIIVNFAKWVNEAENILASIGKTETFSRPIPPAKYNALYNEIWANLECSGKYDFHFQCKYKEQDDFFDTLCKYFCPLGFNCFTDRKTSWAYFTVIKL